MKEKIFTSITAMVLFAVTFVNAQAPQGFNYQAAIRDGSGEILSNQSVEMKFTIKSGSETGTTQYQETKILTTDEFGLIDHAIGTGTAVSGSFNDITWDSGAKFLKVEINTGSGFINQGTQKLMSVPYALYAGNTAGGTWTVSGNNIYFSGGNVGIGNINPVSALSVGGHADFTGNVGIGTTNPARKLEVIGKMRISENGGGVLEGSDPNHAIYLRMGYNGVSDRLELHEYGSMGFYTGGLIANQTERIHIAADGKVGIGTSSPTDPLHLHTSASSPNTVFKISSEYGGFTNNALISCKNSGSFDRAMQFWTDNTSAVDATDLYTFLSASSASTLLRIKNNGNVYVSGSLSKGGGSFRIDHPVDPANKLLYHSFVESPDMMNVYNGRVTTDGNGFASVEMPSYFEALNRDFRYQLTAIGSFAQLCIYQEIENNRFIIRSSEPNIEVCWQVTGIRQDAWANKNRIPNEVDKTGDDIGKYLHPDAFGLPPDMIMPSESGNFNGNVDNK